MERKAASGIMLTLMLIGVALTFIHPAMASGTIYIRADGSIDPPTALIFTADNTTYTFIDNIYDSIVVERSNIVIDGGRYTLQGVGSGNGFGLTSVSNVTIKNTNIKHFHDGGGVRLSGSSNNTITANNITESTFGVLLGDSSNYNSIKANNITDNTAYGVGIYWYSDYNIIETNNIVNNSYCGVQFYGYSNHNIIAANNIAGNHGTGLELSVSSNNNVTANDIVANTGIGIWLNENSNYNSIEANNIRANSDGVAVYSTYNIIKANNITASGIGIFFYYYSSYNTIEANNIADNEFYGIEIYKFSDYHNILKNNIKNNGRDGIYDISDCTNIIANNITNNNGNGIKLSALSNNVTANNIMANNGDGIRLSGSSNIIAANNITANSADGILLEPNYGANNITANTIVANNGGGIELYGSSNNITMNTIAKNRRGIGLWESTYNNSIMGNVFVDNGLVITYPHGIAVVDNLVNGKPLVYLEDVSDVVVGDAGQVILVNCNGILVGNLNLSSATVGVQLFNTTGTTITNNNITNNERGILLWESSNNIIAANNITDNGYGIELSYYSSDNIIIVNNIANNEQYGVRLDYYSSGSLIAVNNITANNRCGIWLSGSSNNVTMNNIANNGDGIELFGSSNNIIVANNITANSADGMRLSSYSNDNIVIWNNMTANNSDGIELSSSSNNIIVMNNIAHNQYQGIGLWESSNNIIAVNNITGNTHGIYLNCSSSNYNSIFGNDIRNNNYGIGLNESSYNIFYHNNFENVQQVIVTSFDCPNVWDRDYPSGGNYWSDYTGADAKSGPNQDIPGSDGIGDTSYVVSGSDQDRYPLMNPMGSPQPPIAMFTYFPQQPVQDETVVFDASISYDRDSNITSFEWNFGDGNITTTTNPMITHVYRAPGTYAVNLTVTDNDGLTHSTTKPITVKQESIPPTTTHDYNGLWHTTDFVIILTATDIGTGVAETYYKINDGPTKSVSADGQPLIATEGTNNKLEYWSVDNAGNEEGHHLLTGIKLDKAAPAGSILINGDATYTTSTQVTLTLTSADAISGVYQVRFSNDGVWDSEPWGNSTLNKPWILESGDGTKTVYYQVKDYAGLFSSYSDSIILDAKKPTADAGADQRVDEDTLVTLDASASTDENGITAYTWAFTDMTPQALDSKNPTYTFNVPGVFTVTLNVTDTAGNWATDTVTITVLDITKPVAKAGPDQTANTGAIVIFNASASSDNVGIVDYEWNFGDGTTGTGKTTTHTYSSPNTYTVVLTVKDAADNSATDTLNVTVPSSSFPIWIAALAVAIIAIAAVVILLLRRRK